jgi:hypothetical protein
MEKRKEDSNKGLVELYQGKTSSQSGPASSHEILGTWIKSDEWGTCIKMYWKPRTIPNLGLLQELTECWI